MTTAAPRTPPAGVKITGTGMAVPSRRLANADLQQFVDTTDEWIVQRTGIRQRYMCDKDERCSDLATAAVRQALGNAGLKPGDLDLLIAATLTPDMITPTVACQVVANLGAVPCGAIEMNLACTGFVAALNAAAGFIRSGLYRNVAIVGAERLTGIINWHDRRTCVIFGDGAGAAIISPSGDSAQGCLYQAIHSDGTKAKDLFCPRTESDILATDIYNGQLNTLQMNGREVFKFAVTTMERYLREAMDACGLQPAQVAMVIPHQSNARIIESARERVGLSAEQVYVNIDRYGNTSAASVGICLHELTESGRVKRGDIVIFLGVGAGVTWATSVWKL
jgi:3-oxoacyl-[acyl-carrier-protein] synthase III